MVEHWPPSRHRCESLAGDALRPAHDRVLCRIRIGFTDVELQEQRKEAGGKWNRRRKMWELRYERVVTLKLAARIVEEASKTRDQG